MSCIKSTFRSHVSRYHPYPIPVSLLKSSCTTFEACDTLPDSSVSDSQVHTNISGQEFSDSYANDDDFTVHASDVGDPLQSLAMMFLYLQMYKNVPANAVQSFIDGVNNVHLMSKPHMYETVKGILASSGITDDNTVHKIVDAVVKEHPFYVHTSRNEQPVGCLSSSKLRESYFRKSPSFVEPVEIVLGNRSGRLHTFMYVSVLEVLKSMLQNTDILQAFLSGVDNADTGCYSSFVDGSACKEHLLFSVETETPIMVGLYYDDWESNNPLGTTRKKYKVCAFYWVLANVHRTCRSALHTIQLAILAKSEDVKLFGFSAILEPLLKDVAALEECGVYVDSLGRHLRGSVAYVVADNLAANSVGGFVESFGPNVKHYCRFCLTGGSDALEGSVLPFSFQERTRENYAEHVRQVLDNPGTAVSYGVKKASPLHKYTQYFHVVDGLPPDACHDLLEGLVPTEIALCLTTFVDKKYFNLTYLNKRIQHFPYKMADKVNCPQQIPQNFGSKLTIGGNMAENLTLIHLLPFMIGDKIPLGDLAWNVLMELKDIVDLVFSPQFTDETIDFLQFKIVSHRQQLKHAFPHFKPTPKLHFLDHYPALIRKFGPLVDVCTLRFEAKHSELKHVAKRAHNMKNILKTLATRHQFVQAYHLSDSSFFKPKIQIASDGSAPVYSLPSNVQSELFRVVGHHVGAVPSAKSVTLKGLVYKCGLFVSYGSTSGLPDFAVIEDIFIVNSDVYFLLRTGLCHFHEHYRAYEVDVGDTFHLAHCYSLSDYYPLPAYDFYRVGVGRRKFIMPKHFILL